MMSRVAVLRFLVAALIVAGVAEGIARVAVAPGSEALRWHDYAVELKIDQMDALGSDPSLVVVGTSMAQQDLVPSVLSAQLNLVSVYNAGINGGVPVVVEPWLLDQVMDRLNVSTVVWGLSALDISAAYGQATESAYRSALNTKDGASASVERTAASFSALVRNRTILREPSALAGVIANQRLTDRGEAETNMGDRGERIDFRRVVAPSRQAEMRGRITPFVLDRDDLAAIARTVDQLLAAGIAVVLVELPVPPRFTDLYRSGPAEHELVHATVTALGAELDVPVVSVAEDFTNNDFVDFTHLGEAAARRFSLQTAEALATLIE
ncbi:MAG: hypothetical protein HKN03_13750 [Acidimicrobiales bacterium]|nr:hypothetical protein [Acidimicrobiales bacterium]